MTKPKCFDNFKTITNAMISLNMQLFERKLVVHIDVSLITYVFSLLQILITNANICTFNSSLSLSVQ